MKSKISYRKCFCILWKKQLWVFALSCLGFFVSLPVFFLMIISNWEQSWEHYTLAQMQTYFAEALTGGNYQVGSLLHFFTVAVAAVAVISAWNAFSYLHRAQQTDFYHALPISRGRLFAMQLMISAGNYLLPAFCGMLLVLLVGDLRGLLTLPALQGAFAAWLLGGVFYLLCYLLAAVAMLLTGQLLTGMLGTAVFFGIGPLLSVMHRGLCALYYRNYYDYGSLFDGFGWKYLSPLWMGFMSIMRPFGQRIPVLILIMVIACAALLAMSWVLVRIRPSEAAGHAMAFAAAGELIKVALTAVASLSLGLIFCVLMDNHRNLWMIFGLVFGLLVCYAVIQMIYHMDIRRIFGNLPALLCAGGIVTLVMLFYRFDLGGYDRYLPKAEQIESIGFSTDDNDMFLGSGISTLDVMERMNLPCNETTYSLLQTLRDASLDFHKKASSEATSQEGDRSLTKSVYVKLKSGRTYKRAYTVWISDVRDLALKLYDEPNYLECAFPLLCARNEDVTGMGIWYRDPEGGQSAEMGPENMQAIWSALQSDLRLIDSRMIGSELPIAILDVTVDLSDREFGDGYLDMVIDPVNGNTQRRLWYLNQYIYPSFTKTIAAIEAAGYDVYMMLDNARIKRVVRFDRDLSEEAVEAYHTDNQLQEGITVITQPQQIKELMRQVGTGDAPSTWLTEGDPVEITYVYNDGKTETTIQGHVMEPVKDVEILPENGVSDGETEQPQEMR